MKLKLCLNCSKILRQKPRMLFMSSGLEQVTFYSPEYLSQRLENAKSEREDLMNAYNLNKKAYKISIKQKDEIIKEISSAIDNILLGVHIVDRPSIRKSLPIPNNLNASNILDSSASQLLQIKQIEDYINDFKSQIKVLETNSIQNEHLDKESKGSNESGEEPGYSYSNHKLKAKISKLKQRLKESKQERTEVERKLKSCKESFEKKIIKYEDDVNFANEEKQKFEYQLKQIQLVYNDLISNNVKFQQIEKESWVFYK